MNYFKNSIFSILAIPIALMLMSNMLIGNEYIPITPVNTINDFTSQGAGKKDVAYVRYSTKIGLSKDVLSKDNDWYIYSWQKYKYYVPAGVSFASISFVASPNASYRVHLTFKGDNGMINHDIKVDSTNTLTLSGYKTEEYLIGNIGVININPGIINSANGGWVYIDIAEDSANLSSYYGDVNPTISIGLTLKVDNKNLFNSWKNSVNLLSDGRPEDAYAQMTVIDKVGPHTTSTRTITMDKASSSSSSSLSTSASSMASSSSSSVDSTIETSNGKLKENHKAKAEGITDAVIAGRPGNTVFYRINARDPEGVGAYAMLTQANPINGISCSIENALTVRCQFSHIPLVKSDTCNAGEKLEFCKEGVIKFKLKDGDFVSKEGDTLPGTWSQEYSIKVRVTANDKIEDEADGKHVNIDSRSYLSNSMNEWMKNDNMKWLDSTNGGNSMGSTAKAMLPDYANFNAGGDYSQYNNNALLSNSTARSQLKGAGGTLDGSLFADAKKLALKGDYQIESEPIFCRIRRGGVVSSVYYVCKIDSGYPDNISMATKYFATENDIDGALNTCLSNCFETTACTDNSFDEPTTFFKDMNRISKADAESFGVGGDPEDSIVQVIITRKSTYGSIINKRTININPPVKRKMFKWLTDTPSASNMIAPNFYLEVGVKGDGSFFAYNDGDDYWVEPYRSYYARYKSGYNWYKTGQNNDLYTIELVKHSSIFNCDLNGGPSEDFSTLSSCNTSCRAQRECEQYASADKNTLESIENDCASTRVSVNGHDMSLKDAYNSGKCHLVTETSLDKDNKPKQTFVEYGNVVNILHPDIEFETNSKVFKAENAVDMTTSFLDMLRNGESEGRFSKVIYNPLHKIAEDYMALNGDVRSDGSSYQDASILVNGTSMGDVDITSIIKRTPSWGTQKMGAVFLKSTVSTPQISTEATNPTRLFTYVFDGNSSSNFDSRMDLETPIDTSFFVPVLLKTYDIHDIGLHSDIVNISPTSTAEMDRMEDLATTQERFYGSLMLFGLDHIGNAFAGTDASKQEYYFDVAEATLKIEQSDTYTFYVDGSAAVDLLIDGQVVASYYGKHAPCNCLSNSGTVHLEKGTHRVKVRHAEIAGNDGRFTVKIDVKSPLPGVPAVARILDTNFLVTNPRSVSASWTKIEEYTGIGTYQPDLLKIDNRTGLSYINNDYEMARKASDYARVMDPLSFDASAQFYDLDIQHPVYLTRLESSTSIFDNMYTNVFAYIAPMSVLKNMTIKDVWSAVKSDYRVGERKYLLWNYSDLSKATFKKGQATYTGMMGDELSNYINMYSPNDFQSFWMDSTKSRSDKLFFASMDDTFRIQMSPNGGVNIVDAKSYDTGTGTTSGVSRNNVIVKCRPGTNYDPINKLCIANYNPTSHYANSCNQHETYNASLDRCESPIVCPEGSVLDDSTMTCIDHRNNGSRKIILKAYDISEFTSFSVPNSFSQMQEMLDFGKGLTARYLGVTYKDTAELQGSGQASSIDTIAEMEGYLSISDDALAMLDYSRTGARIVSLGSSSNTGMIIYGVKRTEHGSPSDLYLGLGHPLSANVWLEKGRYKFRIIGATRGAQQTGTLLVDNRNGAMVTPSAAAYDVYNQDTIPLCKARLSGNNIDARRKVCYYGHTPYFYCDSGFSALPELGKCQSTSMTQSECLDAKGDWNSILGRCFKDGDISQGTNEGACEDDLKYCPLLNKCVTQPLCSNGGVFDEKTGDCNVPFRGVSESKNGYYFVYLKEKNSDNAYFLTPIVSGQTEMCYINEYECDLNGNIYSSSESCNMLCKSSVTPTSTTAAPSVIQGNCSEIPNSERLMKQNKYVSKETCGQQCFKVLPDQSISSVNLRLQFSGAIPNFVGGGVVVKRTGSTNLNYSSLISPSASGDYDFGPSGNGIDFVAMKPGDKITITYGSVGANAPSGGYLYYDGIGRWNDSEADAATTRASRELTTSGRTCKNVSAYYSGSGLMLSVDADFDNTFEDNINLGSGFVCRGPIQRSVSQTITFDGKQLIYDSVDLFGHTSKNYHKLYVNDLGVCKNSGEITSSVVPYFGEYVDSKYLMDKASAVVDQHSSGGSVVDQAADVVFPMSDTPVKLGVTKVNIKEYLDANEQPDMQALYEKIKGTSDIPIPFWDGIYSSDYFYAIFKETGLKKSILKNSDLYIGYGYSQNDDCREFAMVPPILSQSTATNFQPRNLDGSCPSGYDDDGDICSQKKIISTTIDQITMCRPWWELVREYQCDGIDVPKHSIADDLSFGYPRWVDVCRQTESIQKALGAK